MMKPALPSTFELADEQPPDIEWLTVDGMFIKQMLIAKAGTFIPSHSHEYDHTSLLAAGRVNVWADAVFIGEFKAPQPIVIWKGVKHTFQALEDNTLIYCLHNLHGADAVAVLEQHELVGEV